MTEAPDARPRVWLLIDDRPGHRTQVLGVARGLGWPAEEIPLSFNSRERLPTPLLGATLSTLDARARALIAPPFPDLVIGMGRRVTPVARWIKKSTGGRARVVMLGRKVPGDVADLTVRCAHFGQPAHANLLELVAPPTQVDAATLARVRETEPDPMAGLPQPKTLFLVGGPTAQHEMTAGFAERMAREVAEATAALGGGLAIVTSRRTPAAVVEAMRRGAPSARLHEWRPNVAYNPYLAYLAHADLICVTGESESMLAEAVAAARPLTIYPLIAKASGRKGRFNARVGRIARGRSALAPICRRLLADGWVTPRRDLSIMHRLLEQNGWGNAFDGRLNRREPAPHDERREVVRRIAALVETGP